jgi:hypothetical protein
MMLIRPARRRVAKSLGVIAAALVLAQCGQINGHVPLPEEKAIGTSGAIARYHALLNTPFRHPLVADGYIIGIEKSPRTKVGFSVYGPDTRRLIEPANSALKLHPRDLAQQQKSFIAALDDPKVMFVSHILRYGSATNDPETKVDLAYSAYSKTAFGPYAAAPLSQAYENGWAALEQLQQQIVDDVARAKKQGTPFTHLLFASMGWNNDQFESIARYNAIIQHTQRAARANGTRFKPLVIGLTWPSVWGGTSAFDLANRAAHIGSYTVKARDADEIGYGIANYLLNASLPRIEAQTGLPTVLLGHSMGARILTRAYFSADLLKDNAPRTGSGPTVISLQAALSANRFLPEYQLVPPFRWVISGEGGPYQTNADQSGLMAMTWSTHDNANPVARFATGARHVGGTAGAKRIAKEPKLAKMFETVALVGNDDMSELNGPCKAVRQNRKVLYVNASGIIASHGDIANPEVGKLVWKLVSCLGR